MIDYACFLTENRIRESKFFLCLADRLMIVDNIEENLFFPFKQTKRQRKKEKWFY